jgi:hypothetical protein
VSNVSRRLEARHEGQETLPVRLGQRGLSGLVLLWRPQPQGGRRRRRVCLGQKEDKVMYKKRERSNKMRG